MLDTSIITGKVWTGNKSASNLIQKRLYIKIFSGEVWYKAPRIKKAKVYGGELFVRYSQREWPEKKNGSLVGDTGLLESIAELLSSLNLINASQIGYAKVQHAIKETITLAVGPDLAKELVDRGWATLNEIKEPSVPKQTASIDDTPPVPAKSEIVTIAEVTEMKADDALPSADTETSDFQQPRLVENPKKSTKKSTKTK